MNILDTYLGQKILTHTHTHPFVHAKKLPFFVHNRMLQSLTSLVYVLSTRQRTYKVALFFTVLDSWFGLVIGFLISKTR